MTNLPIIYAISWIILLNISLLIPKTWTVRIFAWFCAFGALFCVGYAMDAQFINKPHEAYSRFEFYATFTLVSMVISFPSFVWGLRSKKNSKVSI